MRIGIDARMYGHKYGGIGRYIEELVTRLLSHDSGHHFILFVKNDTVLPQFAMPHTVVRTPIHWYTWREQILLPRLFNTHPVDLMHFPHWNIPLWYSKPYIVTIHDLILLHYPSRQGSTLNWFTYSLKHAAYTLILTHAAQKAAHILTVSEYSKHDICRCLHIPAQRISVAHLGVTDTLVTPTTYTPVMLPTHKPYFLYVGVHYPHKNLEFLCRVFMEFTRRTKHSFALILAGPTGHCTPKLRTLICELNTQSDYASIILVEHPSDTELRHLYTHAHTFVFPTLYEGFGLPPIEAQCMGIPVIGSNVASLPEVLGSSALLLSPQDKEAWIDAFSKITSDPALHGHYSAAGVHNASRFSWDTLASSTRAIYNNFLPKMLQ